MHPAVPYREGPIDPPPRARSSPAPWIALGTSVGAWVFALAGTWTCIAKSLFDTPGLDALIPTACAIALAIVAMAAIRRARNVTPHRNRTRIAVGVLAMALLVDGLGVAIFLYASMHRPPPPPPVRHSDHHMNLCARDRDPARDPRGASASTGA